MPKASNTSQEKKAKMTSAEEKEGKKSLSKPKSDSSYNKFVENAAKVSNKNENNGRRSTSKAEEGENKKSKSKSKKMVLKHPKKTAESKTKQTKEKSPSLRVKNTKKSASKEPVSDIRSKSASRPRGVKKLTSLGKKRVIKKKEAKEKEETEENISESQDISQEKSTTKRRREKDKDKEDRKSKSKSRSKKERSRTKSLKRDKEDKSISKSSPTKPKEDSNTPSKTGSSPTSKVSGSSSRSVRYKEISTGKVPKNFTKHSGKKNSQVSKMKGFASVSSESQPQGGKKIAARNVKESSSNIESSSSIDLSAEQKKRQSEFNYGPDSQRISQEVEEVIKRIEDKKKLKKNGKLMDKKRKRGGDNQALVETHTAKDFDYILQKNPNIKSKPYINLEDLSKHPLITYSDILLALLEVGQNSNSYLFAYSSKSRCFWSDILEYNILKKIFADFKAETLRKYWSELSKYDTEDASDLIKKNKSYLDKLPLKLGTIVSSISKLLSGKIKDLKVYIDNIQVDIRKREIFEHEFQNPVTGELTKVKEVRTTYNTRKRYEPGNVKDFTGSTYNIISLKEVYHQNSNLNDFQKVMKNIKKEDMIKNNYLNEKTEEEKRKLNTINEDDKFVFKAIDNVLDSLSSEFKNYTNDFILDTLQQNSMDITKTYLCLKEPMKNKNVGFTPLDDKVLLRKQGEEYKILLKEKGKDAIQETEEFLNN